MNALFVNGPELVATSRDGRNFRLAQAKCVRTNTDLFQMPVGAPSDGASIPQPLWSTGLAPFGIYWPAAYAHDCAYQGTLLVLRDGGWVPAMLTKDQSDDLLNALMFALGAPEAVRLEIYEGVHLGGWKAFRDDRSVEGN
jgi:Protein of unknown function (DUF1353)